MKNWKEGIALFVNRTVLLQPLSMLFENHFHSLAYPTRLFIRIQALSTSKRVLLSTFRGLCKTQIFAKGALLGE
jgi:hypothetical protein